MAEGFKLLFLFSMVVCLGESSDFFFFLMLTETPLQINNWFVCCKSLMLEKALHDKFNYQVNFLIKINIPVFLGKISKFTKSVTSNFTEFLV